jgi:uncharacterized membrane protein
MGASQQTNAPGQPPFFSLHQKDRCHRNAGDQIEAANVAFHPTRPILAGLAESAVGQLEPFSPRELMSHSRRKPTLICAMTAHACAKIRCIPQHGGHSQMDGLVFARALHVLAAVVWIGGVSIVTTALLPAIRRGELGGDGFAAFLAIERRFVWQARIAILLVGATGIYIIEEADLWGRFSVLTYWWMHAMVGVWAIFAIGLFLVEPFFLTAVCTAGPPSDLLPKRGAIRKRKPPSPRCYPNCYPLVKWRVKEPFYSSKYLQLLGRVMGLEPTTSRSTIQFDPINLPNNLVI